MVMQYWRLMFQRFSFSRCLGKVIPISKENSFLYIQEKILIFLFLLLETIAPNYKESSKCEKLKPYPCLQNLPETRFCNAMEKAFNRFSLLLFWENAFSNSRRHYFSLSLWEINCFCSFSLRKVCHTKLWKRDRRRKMVHIIVLQ